ncbi:MAG TPA: hypothetical protein VNA04_00435 [Thermoanaerobaculia bacterium]|nr:hypothetical protein [Thermoanaerobaculia bacterium]
MAKVRTTPNGTLLLRIPPAEASRLPSLRNAKNAKLIPTENGVLIASRNKTPKKSKVMRAYEMSARRYDKVLRDLAK